MSNRMACSRFLADLAGAIDGVADVDVGRASGRDLVPLGDRAPEALDALRGDKVDRTAAEAASGHPRPVDARNLLGELNHQIELVAAHLEVIAKAAVRLAHESPHSGEGVALERRGGGGRA